MNNRWKSGLKNDENIIFFNIVHDGWLEIVTCDVKTNSLEPVSMISTRNNCKTPSFRKGRKHYGKK